MNRLSELTTAQRESICSAYSLMLVESMDQPLGYDKVMSVVVDGLMQLDDDALVNDIKAYVGEAGLRDVWAQAEQWSGPFK